MTEESVPAMAGTAYHKDNPLTRSVAGMVGFVVLLTMAALCLLTMPYTFGTTDDGVKRYDDQRLSAYLLPPFWASHNEAETARLREAATEIAAERIADDYLAENGLTELPEGVELAAPTEAQIEDATPRYWLGSDALGRPLLTRCLAGGGISIGIGLSAAAISVFIGTLYGAIAGYVGGKADAVMMRIVDVLYGLPYILLVVLLAVAGDAILDEAITRAGAKRTFVQEQAMVIAAERGLDETKAAAELMLTRDDALRADLEQQADAKFPSKSISSEFKSLLEVGILLVAIGGVSWLTMARVIRGQVLSLKARPFMEAARAIGVPVRSQFASHLLPNLLGPIIVYTTLTVPQAILQESFLSFLGIGVRPPLPSWGNLAAEGLVQLNPVVVRWWLILFPCVLLGLTLLSLNFLGEGLREAFDPRRSKK